MLEDTAFEHKSLNSELSKSFDAMVTINPVPVAPADHQYCLSPMYRIQMEQQCMVSGATRVLFMASKWDGEELIEVRHCWYTPDAELRLAIVAGWRQFEIDLADYVPSGVGAALGRQGGGNSLDNTLRIRRIVPTRWVLCDIMIQGIHGGFAHGDMRLFAQDGELMAMASQSVIARTMD